MQKASNRASAPTFSIEIDSSCAKAPATLEAGPHRRAHGGGVCSGLELAGGHARLRGVLRSALRLDFGGVKDSVGAEAPIGQRLRSVAEGVRGGITAFVGDAE